jgi:hypothetical protein
MQLELHMLLKISVKCVAFWYSVYYIILYRSYQKEILCVCVCVCVRARACELIEMVQGLYEYQQ